MFSWSMPASEEWDARPVRAFVPGPGVEVDERRWHDLAEAGGQMVVATHSPIIAAIPGIRLLELGPWGMRPAAWEDLSLVNSWRQFMRDPRSHFRHLFTD